MIQNRLSCPYCGWSGIIDTYRYDENIYCPDCCELIQGDDECPVKRCDWNDNGHCLIADDDEITLGEDCPHFEEEGKYSISDYDLDRCPYGGSCSMPGCDCADDCPKYPHGGDDW